MANRFPLILDTTDGNKIKELPADDNLNLRENSIVNVQNITALGTIDAVDIRVGGNRLVAQAFADLTDTPNSYIGSQNYFVKVKADGTGLEYRPLSDLGNIEIDSITVDTSIVPSVNNVGNIGTEAARFNEIVATTLKGNLVSYNEEIVFNATTGLISYAALQGAPAFLSEFTDDVGYLRTTDLDETLAGLFDEGAQFVTDVQGSVFGDDSTLLVDAVNSIITGDVSNTTVNTGIITASLITSTSISGRNFVGPDQGDMEIDAGASGIIDIGFGPSTTTVNIDKAVIETFDQGTGLGVAQLTADTDLAITAGNRVKIQGGVPFRFASTSAVNLAAIGAQEGDVIYNTTTSRLQMYQGSEWKDVNGNVEATTGTSNFNDVVVAGNLTVQGTTTTIDTDNTTIKDNVIILNQGEIGAGVTAGTSGIEIERGSLVNKTFVWNESVDKWTIGTETFVAGTVEAAFTGILGGATPAAVTGTTITATTGFVGNLTGSAAGSHTGTLDGDVTGSVFADDSGILVDAVNSEIVGNINTSRLRTAETQIALGSQAAETNQGTEAIAIGRYAGQTDQALRGIAIGFQAGYSQQQERGIAIGTGAGATNQGSYGIAIGQDTSNVNQGTNSIAIGQNAGGTGQGANSIAIGRVAGVGFPGTFANSIILNASGSPVTSSAAGFYVAPVRNVANASLLMYNSTTNEITHTATPGTIAANLDQTTISIGATTATTIGIGNAGSTTTINGIVNLPALVAGSITADDSISITTATGNGNAISIGPGGTNTFINLTANNIRFFGPITQNINAQAGITGDLKGSVVADDSTILVDAVNGSIPYAVLSGAPANLSDFNDDLDYATIVSNTIQANGLPVNTELIGNVTGDIVGSVFADDSAVMVDAVNYAMFSDTLTLTPLSVEPSTPTAGMIAVADGTGWNPASNGKNTLVAYLGSAWVTVAAAA